jgi:CRP-like cAMP-binding protein
MSSIDKLEKSPNWKQKNINKGEYLFKEGQVDKNLYVVKSGTLSVEKFTNNTNEKAKTITTL